MITAKQINDKLIEVGGSRIRRYRAMDVALIASTTEFLLNKVHNNNKAIYSVENDEVIDSNVSDYVFFNIGFKKAIDIGKIYFNEPAIGYNKYCVTFDGLEDESGEEVLTSSEEESHQVMVAGQVEKIIAQEIKGFKSSYPEIYNSGIVLSPESFKSKLDGYYADAQPSAKWEYSQIDKKNLTLFDLYSVFCETKSEDGEVEYINYVMGGSVVPKAVCDIMRFRTNMINPNPLCGRIENTVYISEALTSLFR